ncbi:uncharacterized protein LOC119112943 [Pollicipes pollicipes]|uniref:uncharacterized protein LOC119112943 n=1 Tax=Pollicipes pollicipes TaxID=41117 RepID=UPI00188583B6|nr:uncharacterized protein LOC119112943 [Pollicipes pollicipes]
MAAPVALRWARLLLAGATLVALLHSASGSGRCGDSPMIIFVAKGEKKHVKFWNTDSVATPLVQPDEAEEALEMGSGNEAEPAAASPSAGDALFVVTAAGSETLTVPPLYDTQPHIVLPEAPPLGASVADSVVPLAASEDGSGDEAEDELVKSEGMLERDSAQSEGSGDLSSVEATTEVEFLTTITPFDLVAIEGNNVETKKAILPDVKEDELEGSGNSVTLSASATIPLHKYQEIRITHHDPDLSEPEFSGDQSVSVDSGEVDDAERLLTVAGFSGDKVLIEWSPDTEGSPAGAGEAPREGSGSAMQEAARPDGELAADEISLELLEPVDTGLTSPSAGAADTDELLPLVQTHGSIHQLLSALPLGPAAGAQAEPAAGQQLPVPAQPQQVESAPDNLEQLDRLLLLQGFSSGDRVILEHVPDEVGSGSGFGGASAVEDDITLFVDSASGPLAALAAPNGVDERSPLEASGGGPNDDAASQIKPSKIKNSWVAKEATISGSGHDLPEAVDGEIETDDVGLPVVKDSERLALVEGETAQQISQLPVAETEGYPTTQHNSTADTEQQKAAADDSADKDLTKSVSNDVSPEVNSADSLPAADSSGIRPEPQIAAADADSTLSVPALNREALLSSIYRIINDQSDPSGGRPVRRPSWADFMASPVRRDQSQQLSAETVVVGHRSRQELHGGSRHRDQAQQPSEAEPAAAPVRPQRPEQQLTFDAVESLRNTDDQLFRFIRSQPYPFVSALLNGRPGSRRSRVASSAVDCEWQIQTESHLYLLVTLDNLSAPYTVDCDGAYIEVERERDGFEARWCGNRIKQSGSRPHMVFARGEVRIAVYNNGNTTDLPTGFEARVEVVDLLDARQYATFRRSGLNFRRLIQHPLLPSS